MSERKCQRAAVCAIALLTGAVTGAVTAAAGEPDISDPTRAPERTAARPVTQATQPWRLQSTHVSDAAKSAVVDGRIVTVGSLLDGAEVVRIEAGRVELRRGAERITLEMRVPAVKQPTQRGDEP